MSAPQRSLKDLPLSHWLILAGATGSAVFSGLAAYKALGPPTRTRKQAKQLFTSSTSISEDATALDHLLAAFGPDGRNALGTAPGCMVASPSKEGDGDSNNYWFQWPRDSGLCVRSLVEALKQAEEGKGLGQYDASAIERRIKDFLIMSLQLQHTDNPSGTFQTGGIGEPKFNVDGSPFTGSWGRPQNDGPALRSITAARYMAHVLDTRSMSDASRTFVTQQLWAANGVKDPEAQGKRRLLIRDDLDYICREWQSETFELWEEVCADAGAGGGHFHVLMTQRRALLEGAALARRTETLDEVAAKRWDEAAAAITNRLEKFWNSQGKLNLEGGPDEGSNIDWHDERHLSSIGAKVLASPHVLPTLNRVSGQHKPTQADCAVLLGFTHGWDGDVGLKADDTWEPWGERCLATLWRNVQVFAKVYPVNRGRDPVRDGVLCGRYPEDVYDGVGQSIGNPWFLTTFAVSNVLYLTLAHHARTSLPITLTPATLPFFSNFLDAGHARAGATYHRGSHEWESIMRGMREMAEAYLTNAARFAEQRKGKMSEQIDRYSGWMRGARELSWSFASFLAVHQARRLSSSV